MSIIVSGSLAYDRIMDFLEYFPDHNKIKQTIEMEQFGYQRQDIVFRSLKLYTN